MKCALNKWMKTKTQKQIKQGLTLMVHHRAPLRNWNFVKPQTLQISNLTMSKRFWGSFINRAQKLSENSKPLWKLCSERGSFIHPSSKNKGLRDIGHGMNMALDTKKFIFMNEQWLWFHIWFIMTWIYEKHISQRYKQRDRQTDTPQN